MVPPFWLLLCLFVIVTLFLLTTDLSSERISSREFSSSSEEIEISREWRMEWHACLKLDFDLSAEDFWKNFGGEIDKCAKLKPTNFRNRDETKHAFLPKTKIDDKDEIIVTLGIGQDIQAEQELKKSLSGLGVKAKFYGADPMYMQNSKLFSEIGTYFPLAVGATTGMSVASILNEAGSYSKREVYHIELIDYFNDYLKINHIDHLWMDNEYTEYDLFPYFYKGGQLEQAGISICQMNMEVHLPNGEQKKKFKNFVEQIIKDKQWAFLKQAYVGHYRLFMFNFANASCVKKYFNL